MVNELLGENYGLGGFVGDHLLFEYWGDYEAIIRRRWLEEQHKAEQQRQREMHDAWQEELLKEWKI